MIYIDTILIVNSISYPIVSEMLHNFMLYLLNITYFRCLNTYSDYMIPFLVNKLCHKINLSDWLDRPINADSPSIASPSLVFSFFLVLNYQYGLWMVLSQVFHWWPQNSIVTIIVIRLIQAKNILRFRSFSSMETNN